MNTKKPKKIITLSDIQYPNHIDLTAVIQFIKDEQPDEIIHIGDIIDADGVSKYWRGDIEDGIYQTVEEIEGFIEDIHLPIKKAAPKAKIVLTGGNHLVERVRKAIKEKPDRVRLLDLNNYFPDIEIYQYGEFYNIGDLYWTHGYYFNDAHAKKHAVNVGKNLIYGHTHAVQVYSKHRPTDESSISAKSIGCLCNMNPEYRKNFPNQWDNAFHIAYIFPDGSFNDYIIKINNGQFYFNNKLYGKKGKTSPKTKRTQKGKW